MFFLIISFRPAAYNFTVGDFIDRVPLYYPDGYTEFEKLPAGWNPFEPEGDEGPTAWLIILAGENL